jgi:branched-chain amino acid transport system substrate-binding protein
MFMQVLVAFILGLLSFSSAAFSADATGVTRDAIKIGMFGPITSSANVFAKVLYGAAAIYKDINDHGGINGRKLDLVIEDDACDPKKAPDLVTKLVEQDKVFMLHGAWCSSVALAAKPEIVKRPNVPYMVLGAGSAAISTPVVANIFHPLTTSATVSKSIVDFALTKNGAKRIAIVTQDEAGPKAQYQGSLDYLKDHKLEPVESVTIANGAQDATEQAQAIKNKQPDAILAILYPPEFGIFLRDAYKIGLKTTIITVQGTSITDAYKRVGVRDALKDVYFYYPLNDVVTAPALSKYARIFKKYYPSENLDTITFMGMGGALVTADAIRHLGANVTQERFIAELDKTRNFETGIFPQPITFTPKDHVGVKEGKMITLLNNKEVVVSRYPASNEARNTGASTAR